jgi:hypothetical protein
MIVHDLVGDFGITIVDVRERKPIPIVRPGFGGSLVHIAIIGHVVFACIGLGPIPELLAVLELLVFDVDNFG